MAPSQPTISVVLLFPGRLREAAGAWQSDGPDKGPCWRASRGGLKGKRWTDNLVVWPTAASGSCAEMITQSSHQTFLPAWPQAFASTDMSQNVCGPVHMVWLCSWETLSPQYRATALTSDKLFEASFQCVGANCPLESKWHESYVYWERNMKV